jgi:adenine-specific DNA methylase
MSDRRLIEETFPVREVSEHSAREKNIRHGHISTLHIWWARRPLAASRATAYAALVPSPADIMDWQRERNFIVDLSRWENSLHPLLLSRARRAIYAAHAERLSAEWGRTVTVEEIEAGKAPPPRVLDPFAGGGSYPLEALRLGCAAHASDYNPVAVLILKATLEYPQKYGRPFPGMPEHLTRPPVRKTAAPAAQMRLSLGDESTDALATERGRGAPAVNPLLAAVKYWGEWVLEQARRELEQFYIAGRYPPPEPAEQTEPEPERWHVPEGLRRKMGEIPPSPLVGEGGQGGEGNEVPVGYIWARTVPCQNPACGVEIPLMRQFWLAREPGREIALRPVTPGPGHPITFEIVARGARVGTQSAYAPWPPNFHPDRGTVKGAVVTCPACSATIDAATTRRLFREGKAGQRMVAVVVHHPHPTPGSVAGRGKGEGGKSYRLPTESDLAAFRAACDALAEAKHRLAREWGIEPLPDEPIKRVPVVFGVINVWVYGMDTWGDLFNPRQALALLTFADAVRRAHARMIAQGYPEDFARAVATYLGIVLSRLVDKNSVLCRVIVQTEAIGFTFARQALPMLWDYIEMNPVEHSSGWRETLDNVISNIDHLTRIPAVPGGEHPHPQPIPPSPLVGEGPGVRVSLSSATRLPYPDNYFDAVLTDPPYYDNVPYSYLSDFFYVWLKRTVGHLYPDLFSTPLTPKAGEIVAYSHSEGGLEAGKRFFEEQLAAAFREIARVLRPGGIATVVYAHKSTAGWETVINALLDSGLVVSAAWPLNTEMQSRLRSNESAALASSIYIVARRAGRRGVGLHHEVRAELRRHLEAKLRRLWEEGIGGADFFIAAIGSAIEVFGQYEQVIDLEGNPIRAGALLDEVRALATDFAVRQILHDGFAAEVGDRTRFYVLWRWNYGEARVPFDEARKLAQACGLDLTEEWARRGSFVRKEKEFVRVLGPHQRDPEHLAAGRELIDVLHHALYLWEKGDRPALIGRLAESGYGNSEALYRVAQAISESLPLESREKKLLDGFLVGRERLREDIRQARLF